MQRAMQPVLVSAELWGRNLYAGEKLHTRIYVVNDNEEGRDLKPMSLAWSIVDETNKAVSYTHLTHAGNRTTQLGE